jgi:DNA-directed RNA polymerase subunit RPC12/RpoP
MTLKINYKGTDCRGIDYLYYCDKCKHEQEENHAASKKPTILCSECNYTMHIKPTAVHLDADFHDNSKSHNLGWDYDEDKD